MSSNYSLHRTFCTMLIFNLLHKYTSILLCLKLCNILRIFLYDFYHWLKCIVILLTVFVNKLNMLHTSLEMEFVLRYVNNIQKFRATGVFLRELEHGQLNRRTYGHKNQSHKHSWNLWKVPKKLWKESTPQVFFWSESKLERW